MSDAEYESMEDVEEDEADAKLGVVTSDYKDSTDNPDVLAALQDQLASLMSGVPFGFMQSLPPEVKRRVKALKKLQNDMINVESDFYKEVHALELKYAPKYAALFDQRKEVISALREPTDEECDWPSDEEEEEEEEAAEENKAIEEKKEENNTEENKEDIKGIPNFWLTIFQQNDILAEMVQEHDEPILQHLQDIKVTIHDAEPVGFSLEFHFAENDYFTDKILTKRYGMRYEPDPEDPFSYDGPEIIKSSGCTISWNNGKNVTVRTVKKKQKNKNKGTTRTVTKEVQADSFFNFFNPPIVPDETDSDDVDEETEALLAADFEIGHFIRVRVIPRAVLFFTGEAVDNEEGMECEIDKSCCLPDGNCIKVS